MEIFLLANLIVVVISQYYVLDDCTVNLELILCCM